MCYFDGTFPGVDWTNPTDVPAFERELCQSVCSSVTCPTPPPRLNSASIYQASVSHHRLCFRSTGKPDAPVGSPSWITPTAASLKRRSGGSISSHSRGDHLP